MHSHYGFIFFVVVVHILVWFLFVCLFCIVCFIFGIHLVAKMHPTNVSEFSAA